MKKIIALMLSLVMAVMLISACGKSEEDVDAAAVLSKSAIDITLGKTDTVSVLNYTGVVKWVSSDESVATVSQTGVITPVAIGSVAITAELESGKAITCVVDVEAGTSKVEEIIVTGVYSDVSDITVDYNDGNTVSLKADCSPLDPTEELAWSSSDELLARVNNDGLVTLYGNGIVEITATALNGVEGKCIVRIKNVPQSVQPVAVQETEDVPVIENDSDHSRFTSPVPVTSPNAKTSVIVSDRYVYLDVAENFTLTYAVGNSSESQVEWVSSDKSVAIVKDGRIVGIGEGRATISAVTSDGAVANCQVAVGKDEIALMKKEVAQSKAGQ